MGDKKCMKCKGPLEGGIPICHECRMEFKDSVDPISQEEIIGFVKLAEFLNSFEGEKDDLVYLIKSEISDRQSSIMSCCKIVADIEKGTIYFDAPDGNKFAKQRAEEINKLYNALAIIKSKYGG